MERTKNIKTPDGILCGDNHLREDTPTCFTGDWHQEQWKAMELIRNLQARYKCPVLNSGDLFHHWKASPSLLSQALFFLPEDFNSIAGQHDLPQHALELINKSGLHTLEVAGKLNVLKGCHFGQEPFEPSITLKNKTILVWHHMTYLQKPFPGASGGMAEGILRKYPQFDLIVTGDNHTSFTVEYKGRRFVNTGNMTRQSVAQIDFKPCVWLWYAEDNSVEQVFLPIQEGVISREHIDIKEKRNDRIDAFVEELQSDWESNMSFEDNLKRFQETNNIETDVMNLIFKAIEYI